MKISKLLIACFCGAFLIMPIYLNADSPNLDEIHEMVRTFKHQKLQSFINLNSNNINSSDNLQELFIFAFALEGMLRYYEYLDDTQSIKKVSNQGVAVSRKLLDIDYNNPEAHWLMSRFLAVTVDLSNAYTIGVQVLEEVNIAYSIDPTNEFALLGKISEYIYTPSIFGGDLKKAEDLINQTLPFQPKNEDVILSLAIIYKINGDMDKARKVLKDLLIINPDNLTAIKLLESLKNKPTRLINIHSI